MVESRLAGLGLDAVEPLDLGDIPRRCRSFAIDRFDELSPSMAPAGETREPRVLRGQGLVGDEAVALQPPGKTLQHLQRHGVRPSRIELEEHAVLRPEHDPEVTVLRFPGTVRVEQFDERLVDLQILSADKFLAQGFVKATQKFGDSPHPVAHRVSIDDDLVTAVEDLLETIKVQVVAVFGDHQQGEQSGGGDRSGDDAIFGG